jgi:hypothetical protein
MKKIIYSILSFSLIWLVACEQVPIEVTPPEAVIPAPACPEGASAGTASFTKFIAIGNSFVAGVQGGALFTAGQNNSLPAILNKQFECVGAPATFNQPTIGASLGWNLFITQPFLTDNSKPILGRMLLQYGTNVSCATGAPSPKPTPQAYAAGNLEALPNPAANPGFLYTGGTKASLNNFGIPAVTLGQALIPETGAWAGAGSDPRFNAFYGRLAYPGGSSTIIGDAAAAGGSFFLFWLGLDDFFLHAANGGDPTIAPLTASANFTAYYTAALNSTNGLLASNPNLKGVLLNYPDIWKMPHFTSVTYNPIPMSATDAAAATTGFAGYNAALDGLVANKAAFGISDALAAEILTRKVSFVAGCTNKILLVDETLNDLGDEFDIMQGAGAINASQRAALVPYEQVRHSTATDVIPLGAGSIIGTPGPSGTVWGVSYPVGDRYVILPSEKTEIEAARTAFNTTVTNFANANSTRVVVADINAALNSLITAQAGVYNNVTITPNINPPTGIYSEDGAHFNTRGYAFISRVVIAAINTKFTATIPLTNLASYSGTGLPIP